MASLATAGCAHHAQQIGARATQGAAQTIGTKLSRFEPEAISEVVRGTVTGVVADLTTPERAQRIEALAANASRAAAGAIAEAVRATEGAGLQQMANRAAESAVAALGHTLETDTALRGSLTRMSREISASAVAGAREQLASMLPGCDDATGSQCAERRLSELSHAAARGLTAGVVEAARLPLMALSFVAGVLLTLLVVRWRRSRGGTPPLATAHPS